MAGLRCRNWIASVSPARPPPRIADVDGRRHRVARVHAAHPARCGCGESSGANSPLGSWMTGGRAARAPVFLRATLPRLQICRTTCEVMRHKSRQRPEMAATEFLDGVGAVVARLDRHRHAARAELVRCGHQDLRFEHEVLARHVLQRRHRGRIQPLAALRIGDAEAATPADAPVAEFVGQAPVGRLLRTLAQARTDHDVAGMAVGGIEQPRDVVGAVLAVAVHGQHRRRALRQRRAEAVAQRSALAHALLRGAARSPAGRRCSASVSSSEPSSITITWSQWRSAPSTTSRMRSASLSAGITAATFPRWSISCMSCRVASGIGNLHPQRAAAAGVQAGQIMARSQCLEQRQHRRHRVAGGQARQRTVRRRRIGVDQRAAQATVECRRGPCASRSTAPARRRAGLCCARRSPADPPTARRRRPAAPPARRRAVAPAPRSVPAAKVASKLLTAVVGCDAAGADRPVAGRGVVHGIVESRRRHRGRIVRQGRAHVVGDGQVAVHRGEHRRQRRRIASRRGACGQRDLERDGDRIRRAAAFVRRKQLRRRDASARPRATRRCATKSRAAPTTAARAPRIRCLRWWPSGRSCRPAEHERAVVAAEAE